MFLFFPYTIKTILHRGGYFHATWSVGPLFLDFPQAIQPPHRKNNTHNRDLSQ
jgi:hypothetical protein